MTRDKVTRDKVTFESTLTLIRHLVTLSPCHLVTLSCLTMPTPCTLYLVRHGATDNNLHNPPRLQGQRVDLGLSAAGKAQAEQTARFLATRPLAAVFSSPMLRARQTAEAIARLIYEYAVSQKFPVTKVTLWETSSSFATYRGS